MNKMKKKRKKRKDEKFADSYHLRNKNWTEMLMLIMKMIKEKLKCYI